MSTIYNSTDGPLIIDRAGRVLGARERLEDVDVDSSPVSGHLKAGRLVTLDDSDSSDVETTDTVQADPAPAEATEPTAAKRGGRRSSTTTPQEG